MAAQPRLSLRAQGIAAQAAWIGVHVGVLALIFCTPGQLALRDMMVLDHPALTPAALGFGDLPGRATPQDALLALVGTVLPASWFVRALIILGAAGGACGAIALARRAGGRTLAGITATSLLLANPGVIERLVQGQWSLALAVWLLPAIAWAGLTGRAVGQAWLLWGASISPTGVLLGGITAIASARTKLQRWVMALLTAVLSLPWVVPGLLHAEGSRLTAEGLRAFAPLEQKLGTLLGLGGIWNADAQPPSQAGWWSYLGILIFFLLIPGLWRAPQALRMTAFAGFMVAIAAGLTPELVVWLGQWLPGSGLLRDAQKWVFLAIPALVWACGAMRGRIAPWILALACALHVPDAATWLQQLRPQEVHVPAAPAGDLLVVGESSSTLVTRADGLPVVNPWSKAAAIVESGALVVDGHEVDPPSARWQEAIQAWEHRDREGLSRLGVTAVMDGASGIMLLKTGAQPAALPALGVGLLALWTLSAAGVSAGAWLRRRAR